MHQNSRKLVGKCNDLIFDTFHKSEYEIHAFSKYKLDEPGISDLL